MTKCELIFYKAHRLCGKLENKVVSHKTGIIIAPFLMNDEYTGTVSLALSI